MNIVLIIIAFVVFFIVPFLGRMIKVDLRELVVDVDVVVYYEGITTKLRQILDDATDKWETRVTRVEIQRIEPPSDVTETKHRQMQAERDRRAMILEAETIEKIANRQATAGIKVR